MAQKKQSISGYNVYKDEKGRDILYVKSQKAGYVVKESDYRNFTLYHNRYALVLVGIVLGVNFFKNIWICLAVGLGVSILLEYNYRTKFLPSLTKIENFTPKEKMSKIQSLAKGGEKGKVLLLAILYLAFGILLVINSYQLQQPMYILACDYVILAVCIYMSAVHFIAVTKMK